MAVHTFPFDFPLVFLSFPFISFHSLSFSNYCPFVCRALDVSRAIGWDFCFRGASAELPRSFRGKRSDGPIFLEIEILSSGPSYTTQNCFRELLPRSFRELPRTVVLDRFSFASARTFRGASASFRQPVFLQSLNDCKQN